MTDVRPERTEWRDLEMSVRHRKWGCDCPAVDIDFLLVEYDRGQPVALVEYKHERAAPQYITHPSYRALIMLGNLAGLPVFTVRYAGDFSIWKVMPLNKAAERYCPKRVAMDELEWVTLLYRMRGRETPANVVAFIASAKPENSNPL